MFEELRRELRRLQGARVAVSIPADAEGYLDRECPDAACKSGFKVFEADWRHKVRDEEVFCPCCRHAAPADQWATEEQQERLKAAAIAHVQNSIGKAMRRDADSWNRRQPRNSFIRMTMRVDGSPRTVTLPPAVADLMRLKIACEGCGCRFAVIGVGSFCPACGANGAAVMFGQSLSGIRNALKALPTVSAAISDPDVAATTTRQMAENAVQNAVTTFQHYAEALYARFPSAPQPRRNAFQNLADGSALWRQATGKQYADYLNATELAEVTRYFQQRHLLAHRQGVVDADYVRLSGDMSYQVGRRLVVSATSVIALADLIEKLSSGMASERIP